jgi:hypothetical protein
MKLKAGTRTEVRGWDLSFNETWGLARIGRWHPSYRDPASRPPGYHPITFDDGAKLLGHESSFRVVDNRATP